RQWIDYTGIQDAEQLGYGWLDQVHPADRDQVREAWRSSVKTGVRFDIAFRIRRSDGTYRWFKTRAAPILDAQGTVLKWYGTSTDVDDLKRADEDRTNLRSKMAAILDVVTEGVVVLDRERMVVNTINAAAERLLGCQRNEVTGKRLIEAVPQLQGSLLDAKLREVGRDKAALEFDLQLSPGESGTPSTSLHLRITLDSDGRDVLIFLHE
ncbi:MAG TPA: PAS domain-containing protein, partial [Polyangium sp.]|nr:PAS domain-containing protein [Polyangium sp.]